MIILHKMSLLFFIMLQNYISISFKTVKKHTNPNLKHYRFREHVTI